LKVGTLQELMTLARSQPGKLNYGSSSATGRVASEAFRQMAGIDAVHVPYKTSAQAVTDLISGQLHFLVTDAGLGVAQSQAGRVKALAITSSRRVPAVPDLPTMAEAGLPGYEFVAWLALCSREDPGADRQSARRDGQRDRAQSGDAGVLGEDVRAAVPGNAGVAAPTGRARHRAVGPADPSGRHRAGVAASARRAIGALRFAADLRRSVQLLFMERQARCLHPHRRSLP
jgi:hypothetical protein